VAIAEQGSEGGAPSGQPARRRRYAERPRGQPARTEKPAFKIAGEDAGAMRRRWGYADNTEGREYPN
jgi:hypothetical protein